MGRSDETYERPLIEPENLMTGGFQTGRFDAAPNAAGGRSAARWSIALAVLWIGGIGSVAAIALAVLALASGDIGPAHRRAAFASLVLGAVGVVVSAVIFFGG